MTNKKKTGIGPPAKNKNSDYDSAWKDVIEMLFESFLEFFFPHIYKAIDFSKGTEILSHELRQTTPRGKVGRRHADILMKVYPKDSTKKWFCLFIHVEVQGQKEEDFMTRMFIYYYRTFDKYREDGTEVISLAVLSDENKKWRPDEYTYNRLGFEHRMKFPMVKITDYKTKKALNETLETSSNPMAFVVNAQLKCHELKNADNKKKSTVKWELIRECYKGGYTRDQIDALLKFIDWIIRLPEALSRQLSKEISKLEEDYKMAYVTSWERIAKKDGIKEGMKDGMKDGIKVGMKDGIKEGKLDTARELLKRGVDMDIIAAATGFPKQEIEKLAETVH